MRAYYNEIDRYCCDWLQNLMDAGLITSGKIDDRSIVDVTPEDVRGYERCHFFAGIAGWEHALTLSGYAGPVWTGSCPCQPFSAAGKGKASSDERHLWPEWFRLIRAVRPPIIFGEQVEAAIGWGWLDLVHSDLEAEGYTVGAAVLPACSVGAPHIRQRLWFVGDASAEGLQRGGQHGRDPQDGSAGELADATQQGERRRGIQGPHESNRTLPRQEAQQRPERRGASVGMGNADSFRCQEPHLLQQGRSGPRGNGANSERHASPWSDLIWLPCTDGKQRPTQSGIFPLAHGVPARVAKLRAAGNAITPQCAAQFIKASMT